jgi:hypothetical protein
MSAESYAKGAFATAAGISSVGFGLLYYGQNYLIYPSAFPPGSRTEVPVPTDFGLPYLDVELVTSDHVKIKCYLLTQRTESTLAGVNRSHAPEGQTDEEFASTRPTVIMFHGNGGNMGHRIPLAKVLYVKLRCNVLMVSYRGYGHSEGSPSEKGLQIDSQTALDFLLGHDTLSKTQIILYGQSIGGAVSVDLASKNTNSVQGLILENTFMTLPSLVPTALPILSPFSFLCHQKWDSAKKLPGIPATTAILMLSGLRDEVVPKEQMKGLWDIVKKRRKRAGTGVSVTSGKIRDTLHEEGERKTEEVADGIGKSRFVEFENGSHNDTCVQPGYWNAISEFIASISANAA